jgi:hypothetical protein
MFRRFVTFLLLPLLLLPTICGEHAHATAAPDDPAGLDRQPHIHLRFFLPWWPLASDAAAEPSSSDCGLPDHDDDAVYFPELLLLGWTSESSHFHWLDTPAILTQAPTDLFRVECHSSSTSTVWWEILGAPPDPTHVRSLPLLV